MSTFNQGNTGGRNARERQGSAPKDNPTPEEVKTAEAGLADTGGAEIPASNPGEPAAIANESEAEAQDRHIASTELPVGEVTPEETQADTDIAEEVAEDKIVPGAAAGPHPDGTVVNDAGRVAYAPPGSYNAAANGVQEDAAGHVDSVGTDNSSRSNTRI